LCNLFSDQLFSTESTAIVQFARWISINMGRRKRRNSDVDESLEESYHRPDTTHRPMQPKSAPSDSLSESMGPKESLEKKDKTTDNIINAKEKEDQQIEVLRRKKLERKERKRAKQAIKKEQAEILKKSLQKEQQQKEERSRKKSRKSDSNCSTSNFITIQKGVQYQDVIVGKGAVVQDRKKIRVAYTLRAKNRYGKILDTSNDFRFRLGRGEVIEGWDLGVQGMRVGGKRYLIVPPEAGYGKYKNIGAGQGGILFFEVTLLAS